MRILVVGAGVAGLTLAGGLCRQARPPLVVEAAEQLESGYALGLYPFGARVLHGLGLYARLLERGLVVERYDLADERGRTLQRVDMSVLTGQVGPMVMIERRELLVLLETACRGAELRRGVTVSTLTQGPRGVEVGLSDGTDGRFDAVVAADGINSPTRELVFGAPNGFDTDWTLLTWWCSPDHFDARTVREWWGRGRFLGAYPSPERTMCAAGAPSTRLTVSHPQESIRELLARTAAVVPEVAAPLRDIGHPYRWSMRDTRAQRWVEGRVGLCGDAAVGFLPTAGVGASSAMRCATALADELSRAGAETVPLALRSYERRCRKATETIQSESRRLARVMFAANPVTVWLRDRLARHYPAERMLGQIVASSRRVL